MNTARIVVLDKPAPVAHVTVGKTVTRGLPPNQAATLALRSSVDATASDGSTEHQDIKRAGAVSVIRDGVPARQLTSQK